MRLEWNQTSLLSVLLAEPHRNPDQRARPYTTTDFHPLLERDDNADDGPDWALWSKITGNAPVHTLDIQNLKITNAAEQSGVTNAFD
jgi:hypothetical protein